MKNMINKQYEGIYYSRFAASWVNMEGCINYEYREWLESLTIDGKKIPDNIVQEIYDFSYYFFGKAELETDIERFMKNKNESELELELEIPEPVKFKWYEKLIYYIGHLIKK